MLKDPEKLLPRLHCSVLSWRLMWDLRRGMGVNLKWHPGWEMKADQTKALILFNIIHLLENHSRRRLFEDLHPACFKKMTTEPQYWKFIFYWLGCPVGKIAPKPSNAIFHVWCRICLKTIISKIVQFIGGVKSWDCFIPSLKSLERLRKVFLH